MSVHVERATPEISAKLDGCDVFEKNRHSVVLRNDGVFQIGNRIHQTNPAHDKFHSIFLDNFSADVEIALFHGVHHVHQHHATVAHFQRRDFNLILLRFAADAGDLRDAGNGIQLITHEPILN